MNGHDNPEIFPPEERTELERAEAIPVPFFYSRLLTGGERLASANKLVLSLNENFGGLETYVFLKQAAQVLSEAIDLAKEAALRRMDSREVNLLGAKIETKSNRKWEYDDPELGELESQIKLLQEKVKIKKRFLESLPSDVVNAETGEITKKAKLLFDGLQIAVTLPK